MMNRYFIVLLAIVAGFALMKPGKDPVIEVPKGWPKPTYDFRKNPLNEPTIELGRQLFYDPILSRNNQVSCASCHLQQTAFTHIDHALSHGIDDRIGNRNSPALVNLAWGKSFMWDGAVNHLDVQALAPIENHLEMDEKIANVVKKLQASKTYRTRFFNAFGDSTVTGEHTLKAISQFLLTLPSTNSKYDKVMRKEKGVQFTKSEQKGYVLFKKHCASCHTEPLFTNNAFENNGLIPDSTLNDFGRMTITHRSSDSLKFKVPTLRNIERSPPYMHDGRFRNLQMVLFHYSNGIHHSPTLSPQLKNGIALNEQEKGSIIVFLKTLTDADFLANPKYGYPR